MRCLAVVISSLLLAGLSTASVRLVPLNAGDNYTFNSPFALTHDVAACILTAPNDEILIFKDGEVSPHGDKYVVEDNIIPCSITLKGAQSSDSGVWLIAYENTDGTGDSQAYELVVTGGASIENPEAPTEVDIDWLSPIEFPTRTEQNIDLSLSKKTYAEECYIIPPGGEKISTANVNIEGVEIHNGKSDYVSCRITIGPMEDSLLGDWTLCSRPTDNKEENEKCQTTRITWNNNANPKAPWDIFIQTEFSHVVHLGGILTPVVQEVGNYLTCHIITPNGEDLVLSPGSDYPNLKLVTTSASMCSVAIGPLTQEMLSNWTLYGRFRDFTGLRELRLPMTMFLYDPENPYDQAYNVTTLNNFNRAVNLGTDVEVEVSSIGNVDSCKFEKHTGEVVESQEGAAFINVDGRAACRLAIGPITQELLGSWTIIGKFSNGQMFSEIRQPFQIVQEDPNNPLEEDRVIELLSEQHVMTDMGSMHNIIIHKQSFVTGETCHVRTPAGLQYKIMDGFSIPGVSVMGGSDIECGISVSVNSEDNVGTWTLIARGTRFSDSIERRLPFTINVEEIVDAVPSNIVVAEGNSLHVRLVNPTDQYQTCKLYEPDGSISGHAPDPTNTERCGFLISNITAVDNGTWEIVYGSRKMSRARIHIELASVDSDASFSSNIDLIRDRAVNMTVGPSNAVYCRLVNPNGVSVFEDFGACILSLDKVISDHAGVWKMTVATTGRVLAEDHQLFVTVRESGGKASVSTSVVTNKPVVTLSCGVAVDSAVRAFKFRDPQGRILIANGVNEDRFTSNGVQTSYSSQIQSHECTLQITDPEVSDLGLWRCAFETEEDTYYGFLTVICPWAIQVPEIAAVVQQHPILRAQETATALEDEPVTMSCSVEAVIQYCYFRFQNGTVFTVYPGMSSNDMEYVGAGFDAGECGVRFTSMRQRDSGRWSCHVGLVGQHEEQRSQFEVTVQEAMRADHRRSGNSMTVEGLVHDARALDYCRFVRMDGFGFTTGNTHLPDTYTDTSSLTHGICQLIVTDPSILDLHPWTIVAKIRGQDGEISRDTMHAIVLDMPTPEGGDNDVDHIHIVANRTSALGIFFYVLLSVLLVAILLGVWLGPKKNREWTYARTTAIRNSFMRTSIRKEPLPPQEPPKYEQTV